MVLTIFLAGARLQRVPNIIWQLFVANDCKEKARVKDAR
jgi:hypothetical protein